MQKIKSLESLRGLCAIIVVLYHFGFTSTSIITNNLFIENGFYFVDFFFVLSGFVIYKNYVNYFDTLKSIFFFQAKRFFRLYPLHIFVLFFFVIIEFLKLFLELKFDIIANNPAFSSNNLQAFIHNLFLTHGFLENFVTFNSPSWSISTEFYTYFIFALTTFFIKKKYLQISLLIIFTCGIILYLKSGHQATAGYLAILRCMYAFFLGSLINLFIKKEYEINSLFLFIFLIIIIFSVCFSKINFEFMIPILFSIFIFLILTTKENSILKILNKNYLVFLGKISYGIYMIHSLVWWGIRQILRFIFKIESTSIDGNVLLILNEHQSLICIIIGLFLTIFLASMLYKYIEKPFINYAKKNFI
jgi:peptidoglycan/LPS O-acetylase OafA/YrhL